MGQWIDLTGSDGFVVPAWVAEPVGPARGTLVVLQEIFGVNAHIRDVTERWARVGYLAVAPALFARVQADVDLGYGAADMAQAKSLKAAAEALPDAGVLVDIQAAIDYADARSAGPVGVVGFCWGGLLAWRAACTVPGLAAAVCYYGGGMTNQVEKARTPRCPVLAHFGRLDAFISQASVQQFAAAQPPVQVYLYDADHGFHCEQRGAYDAAAAASAHARTLAFFARHLGAEPV
ncbi:dienelactone hydrolase family protein [Simplicispira psychrophila]|uniref:dienelactone hydrolase family protein n=1 Tax=Simplicispira psychrophila TaxID=80882 RepID=UPI000489CBEC|nr:dienelactone hydrolase family protein [Simplicispira psychrophila]